ncbi:MAG: hypothetical protein ACR2MU_06830 [Gaiellaceae bacterium]
MREQADEERIRRFMRAIGRTAAHDGTCFLAGGATAVLVGWRATTVDVDIKLEPEQDEVMRALPQLKEECFDEIEPELYRFSAIDQAGFRVAVEDALGA